MSSSIFRIICWEGYVRSDAWKEEANVSLICLIVHSGVNRRHRLSVDRRSSHGSQERRCGDLRSHRWSGMYKQHHQPSTKVHQS